MAQALKKFGIKDFAKMRTLAPIFSSIDDVFLTKLDHSQARCVFPLLVAVFVASNIETRQTIL